MFRNTATSRSNLAARMGRWSASHWKTATFGWLALRRRRLRDRRRGRDEERRPEHAGPGESGRMDRILDAGFKQPAAESVLIQSDSLAAGRPAFRPRSRTSSHASRRSRPSRTSARRSTRQRGPDREGRARGARRVRHPRRQGRRRSTRSIRCSTSVDEAQTGPPGLLHRRVRRRERREGRRHRVRATTSGRPGVLSLPITLIILVVAFGALVAAGIPLLLALTAVFATFGLSRCPARCCRSRCRPPRSCC